MCELFAQILGVDRISIDYNVMDLAGKLRPDVRESNQSRAHG
ncbi:hypothetical protein ACLQ22_09810 [Micromonospora sp. DT178]